VSVVSSARVGVAKADREIHHIAAERAAVAACRCLFVDDLLENVEAATAYLRGFCELRVSSDVRMLLAR
jgi:putative hydrolase of the HAD superfamily